MSLLSEALTAHASRLHDAAGELVTYVRGSTQITNVEATRGQTRFEEIPSEGEAIVQTKSFDWLIRPSKLKTSAGVLLEPTRGDQVITASGDTYEVFPGADDKHWQYSDQYETFFRIHTVKRV